jgi:hypothetical protein
MPAIAGQVIVIASATTVADRRVQFSDRPQTQVFCETDFLTALDVIFSERPEVIALDPMFAATARGAALVARVKADPLLKASEIRTLSPDGLETPASSDAPLVTDSEAPSSPASQPLDSFGTRRAPRYVMAGDVEAKVNGTAGRLVDLSVTGSQMLAPIRLRPAEGIRVTLSDESLDLRLSGTIAWISLEISAKSSGQRYRFGIEFQDANRVVLEQFCARHRDDR